MATTETGVVEQLPIPGHKLDVIAHACIMAGAVLHSIGGRILRTRNEELTDKLHEAHGAITEVGHAAYALGRQHERDGVPLPDAVDADVDQGDNPAAPTSSSSNDPATFVERAAVLEHEPAQK